MGQTRPVPVLREVLSGIEGVDEAFIYGSWAARRAGESGEFPRDIDALVVGGAARRALADAAREASSRLGVEVNFARVPREEWEAAAPTPFLATVKARPMLALVGDAADD